MPADFLYQDGDKSLADSLRRNLPKEVADYFGSERPQSAYFFSSSVSWKIEQFYPNTSKYDPQLSELMPEFAHASLVPCDELSRRHSVLCVHKNERGVLTFSRHKVGSCPIILDFLKSNDYPKGT